MTLRHATGLVAIVLALAAPAAAQEGLVVKESAHDVSATLDRLEQALSDKGIMILARVDHGENAQKVDMELAPTQLLIFGNPKLGTPLMQSARSVGIDLPMKALAWEDEDGTVWLAYNAPDYFATRHEIDDRGEVVEQMTKALDALTDVAIGAE